MRLFDLFENHEFTEGYLGSGRAPLYHATNLMAAVKIIQSNRLSSDRGGRESRRGAMRRFVSLTRSLAFALTWRRGDVIFVFDQDKLRQRFAIHQFDYFKANDKADVTYGTRRSEAEEYIERDIFPLDEFLIEILVTRKGLAYNKKMVLTAQDSVPKDPTKPHTGLNNKFVKRFKGVNDPAMRGSPYESWLDRNVVLKHPKARLI